ncbi:MAG: hypothetical protein CMB56_006555 [Methanobacteriota archaeon]|nr:MAG: hypothetical protein CMB56_006555 [Euryarchaeota archaeon]|tara:strand:- start:22808 stop:23998 length:1191 start_codon:yes stop_codon:yes gene_type:complete
MQTRLLVAVRDFDSLVGGAEKSLTTLILGIESLNPELKINIFQSSDRIPDESLFHNSSIEFIKFNLNIEDLYSGLSWKFRNRKSGRPMKFFRRIHLKKKNRLFSVCLNKHFSKLIKKSRQNNEKLLGVTQLDWSAGASSSFIEHGIPYVVFVRDEVCFQYPELFRRCLEKAESVLVAGTGLATQIREKFNTKSISIVHLPINFDEIYPKNQIQDKLDQANKYRLENKLTNPRIAIVGMVPEKGFKFYNNELIPKMNIIWPEATVHIYGGGPLSQELSKHSNTFDEGYLRLEEIFPFCDIHLFRLELVGTWGRVINEAGYFFKPTISNDIGSQPEAVGEGGIIMPISASAEEWIEAMKEIYSNLKSYGNSAHQNISIVDKNNSIQEFFTVIDGVFND